MSSTVVCGYADAQWEINSVGQDACRQYAALVGTCDSSFTVGPVTPSSPPYQPTAACACNVVAYNLQAACAWCQDNIQSTWWSSESSWAGNCTGLATYDRTGLPSSVSTAGLTIPAWATLTVNAVDDTWRPSRASAVAVAATLTGISGTATATATGFPTFATSSRYTGYGYSSYSYSYGGYDPYNLGGAVAVGASAVAVAAGVSIGLSALTILIAVLVYCMRQKRRQAWYRPLAAHYQGNGAPPAAGGGYAAPLLFHNEPNVPGSPSHPPSTLPSSSPAPSQAYAGYQPPPQSQTPLSYGSQPAGYNPSAYTATAYDGPSTPYDPRASYVPPPPGGPGGGGAYPPPGTNPFNTPYSTPGGPPPGAGGAHGYTGHAEVY